MGLLDALLSNESGGRNVANVDQGTSSGQAQGYFQITTGTWDDFGGRQYAANPLAASYEQQADIASRIPLRRWDESTIAKMRATGIPIDPNRTLGENLAMNGESFAGGAGGGGGGGYSPPAAASPAGRDRGNFQQAMIDALATRDSLAREPARPKSLLADTLASSVRQSNSSGTGGVTPDATDQFGEVAVPSSTDFAPSAVPETAPARQPETPVVQTAQPTPLADLFKVRDIGIKEEIDPVTGRPRPYRSRRAYG